MACARCDFYTPKDSSKGQLLEAKDNLQRMLATIPLTDEEQARSTTVKPHWTGCWRVWQTSPPPPARPHVNSCRSSKSGRGTRHKLELAVQLRMIRAF
jgi:hypothetical protein